MGGGRLAGRINSLQHYTKSAFADYRLSGGRCRVARHGLRCSRHQAGAAIRVVHEAEDSAPATPRPIACIRASVTPRLGVRAGAFRVVVAANLFARPSVGIHARLPTPPSTSSTVSSATGEP